MSRKYRHYDEKKNTYKGVELIPSNFGTVLNEISDEIERYNQLSEAAALKRMAEFGEWKETFTVPPARDTRPICSADGCSLREPCGPFCRDNGNFK